jgi:hypothetical protein
VLADTLTLKKDAPKTYIVKKGDTLWDISGIFLNQPWLWPKLWRLNPDIKNPHLIYPGDELRLVFDKKGEPMLVKGKPKLKWSPHVRKTQKDLTPISTIPLSVIAPYIKYATILTEQQRTDLPYVLGSDEGYKSSLDAFKLYVNADLPVGNHYAIYNRGEPIYLPETGELVGYYSQLAGTAQAIRAGNMAQKIPSTLLVKDVEFEIRSGFYVVPVNDDQMLPAFYQMQAANSGISAKIIKVASDAREFGKLEVVLIDKGAQAGVKLGDVFNVARQSPSVIETNNGPVYTRDTSSWNRLTANEQSDYKMPTEIIGKMMVFNVFEQVSMALILTSEKPVRLQDTVISPN